WLKVFQALIEEPDLEWAFIDGTYVKAHQHSSGAASDQSEAIGKSRAGNTSKIHLAVDAHGLPVAFEITGGNVNDCTSAPELIAQLPSAEAIVADKGHDSERIREQIEAQGARAVIPRKRNSLKGNGDLDGGAGNGHSLAKTRNAAWRHLTRNPKGRGPSGAARRRSSFIWNDQTSLLVPCSAPNGPPLRPASKRQQALVSGLFQTPGLGRRGGSCLVG
ncbi:IS5 family transposase, partial [Rhodococcus erythropolis]|uniref:IS5 family transposase n=1 Tax=Rhodococcus erythropolis TaxID=1833 RepID=UPI0020166659